MTFTPAPSPLRPKTFTLGQSAGRRETENVYGRMTVDTIITRTPTSLATSFMRIGTSGSRGS
jgi:hypothetical protein